MDGNINLSEFKVVQQLSDATAEALRIEVGGRTMVDINKTKSEWALVLSSMLARSPK